MYVVTLVVHWLHVFAGAVWLGGQVFGSAVLWPALLVSPPAQARAFFDRLGPLAGRVMGPAGLLTLVLGVLRGTWLGMIRSAGALATPYGVTFLVALVLTLFLFVYGERVRAQVPDRIWDGDVLRPGARRFVAVTGGVTLGVLLAILACMVLLRFGL